MTIQVEAARTVVRVGGISAIALGLSYLIITALYAVAGVVPSDARGEVWLAHLGANPAAWWGIVGFSVLTDLLFLPLAVALYVTLRVASQGLLVAGVGLVMLFALLDLAVTWPQFASLLTLSADYRAPADDVHLASLISAATYAASVLDSSLFAVYVILVPGLGVLAISLVMLRGGPFNQWTASTGVLAGIGAIIAVVGGFLSSAVAALVIATAVLTTVWVLLVGYRLISGGAPVRRG